MAEPFSAVEVIVRKRDRAELSDAEIDWWSTPTRAVSSPTSRCRRLAMAILLNGMERREISRWTNAMIASGERMDFSDLSRPTADKHSTGGVGDKITLPLAPAGRRLRCRSPSAVRPRPRPHRRHPRQARVDPGLAGAALQRGDVRPVGVGRRGHLCRGRRARTG